MDTIDGMKTFLAVVEAQSFREGADRRGISPALASKYVGQLEARLGQRLLNRTTRSLSLTEAGENYLQRCRQLVQDFDELENAVRDPQQKPSGRLVVSAPVTFGELFLAPAVAEFASRYPDVSLDLRLSDRFVSLVEEGVDVALRIARLGDSSLVARKLAEVDIVACASTDYLAEHGTPAHPHDLQTHNCVIDTNFRNERSWPFRDGDRTLSIRPSGRLRVNSAMAARALVLSGQGVGLIPGFVVETDIRSGKLVRILSDFDQPAMGLHALYAHRRHLASKIRVFVEYLGGHFGRPGSMGAAVQSQS